MTVTLNSGITTASIPLTGLVGNLAMVFFMIRSSSPTRNNQVTFNTTLSTFEFLNSTGQNIQGGQTINDVQLRYMIAPTWVKTTFPAITQGCYLYSWSQDPWVSIHDGTSHGTYQFTGAEQLKLVFTSALGAAAQIDIWGLSHEVVTLGAGGAITKSDL